MRRAWTITAAAVVAALAVAGAAVSKEAVSEPKELKRYAATGETELCIDTTRIRSTKVLDNQHILFKMNGGKTYLNKLPHRCGQLGINRAFSFDNHTPRLCNTEIIRVVSTATSSGGPQALTACGIGKFVLLEKIENPEEN